MPRCRKSSSSSALAALVVTCLAALALMGATPNAGGQQEFPARIGPLSLVKVVTHRQAEDQLDSIHDEKIPVASAAIAYYQGTEPGARAVVWWSRAASEAQARDQIERMVAKIKRSGYGYSDYRELHRAGLTVHAFAGKGEVHYTYRKADQLYWISAPAGLVTQVYDAVMK